MISRKDVESISIGRILRRLDVNSTSISHWDIDNCIIVECYAEQFEHFIVAYQKKSLYRIIELTTMSFEIDCEYSPGDLLLTLKIDLIGYFSVDGNSQYHADLSQLKYYIPPPNPNNVSYDLTENFHSTRYKPESYEKLDFILQWITENFNRLEKPLSAQKESWLNVDFICRRGMLKTLLQSPYRKYDKWIICASKYHGTIYLCHFYTDEEQNAHASPNKQHTTWSYKFQQYMVAGILHYFDMEKQSIYHPSHEPNPSVPLNMCEEFHCMFKAKFGDHSLLYGAETDGIFSQQPIKDTLIGKNFELMELKTSPMCIDAKRGKFGPGKAIQWWSQNYLVGAKKIICGLYVVKDKATVRMIKKYPTDFPPRNSKTDCDEPTDVRNCKKFCNVFLDNVKKIVTKDYNECMYKFHWNPLTRNIVSYSEEAPNNEIYFFLKEWFVEKAEKYKNTYQ